jgi:hypothetical protein
MAPDLPVFTSGEPMATHLRPVWALLFAVPCRDCEEAREMIERRTASWQSAAAPRHSSLELPNKR